MPDYPSRQIDLGSHIRLWVHDMGGRGDDLVITAHGGSVSRPGGFNDVPSWTTLVMYGPHKKSLDNPGLTPILTGTLSSYEILAPGDRVRNYRLTHFEDDNDNLIKSRVELNRDLSTSALGMLQEMANNGGALASGAVPDGAMMASIQQNAQLPKFDVLRIVKSGIKGVVGITLMDVLDKLKSEGYNYARIHCSFCRSTTNQIVGEKLRSGYEAPSHDASTN